MSGCGFNLVPVDGGGDPIHLPTGETVLGRGPFLGVNDKRVSRSHGLLENLNGRLRLKPTHLNPCFFQSSLSSAPKALQRSDWFVLRDGDLFSLLPGQLVYRVEATGRTEQAHSLISEVEEKEEKEAVCVKADVESPPDINPSPADEPTASTQSIQGGDNAPLNKPDKVPVVNQSKPKRVLPSWMMAAVTASHSPSSSASALKVQSTVRKRKEPAATNQEADQKPSSNQSEAPKTSTNQGEAPRTSTPQKKRRKMSHEEQCVPAVKPSAGLQSGTNRSEVSDKSDSVTMETDQEGTPDINNTTPTGEESDETEVKNEGQKTKRTDSVGSNGGSTSGAKPGRRPCPYGKDCYRKNPAHFQESSHPGDTDYEEEEEEEEDELPECPYGTDCYRKNPLHRKEFKHTKRPGRAAAKRKAQNPSQSGSDEDEDEDEDSFINDSLSEAGDDSDYLPPDSDSGKEDVSTLRREAKDFVRKRN